MCFESKTGKFAISLSKIDSLNTWGGEKIIEKFWSCCNETNKKGAGNIEYGDIAYFYVTGNEVLYDWFWGIFMWPAMRYFVSSQQPLTGYFTSSQQPVLRYSTYRFLTTFLMLPFSMLFSMILSFFLDVTFFSIFDVPVFFWCSRIWYPRFSHEQ